MLIGAGFACQSNAGPTRLDDAPSLVEDSGSKLESKFDPGAPLAPVAGASVPSGGTAGASRIKRDRSMPDAGGQLFRQDPSDAFSMRAAAPSPAFVVPEGVAPREAGRAGRAGQPARPGEDNATIKEYASSALGWMHEVLPWTAGGHADLARDIATVPSDNAVLPMETERDRFFSVKADRGPVEANAAAAGAQGASLSVSSDPGPDRRQAVDPAATNSVRQMVKLARELLIHPLTWLVIVLVGIAQIVVSRSGRRK